MPNEDVATNLALLKAILKDPLSGHASQHHYLEKHNNFDGVKYTYSAATADSSPRTS